jgi:hypothetical protein
MESRARQLLMSFEKEQEVSWLPEQAQRDLVATLADLLLDAVEEQCEGESNEPEDPR